MCVSLKEWKEKSWEGYLFSLGADPVFQYGEGDEYTKNYQKQVKYLFFNIFFFNQIQINITNVR